MARGSAGRTIGCLGVSLVVLAGAAVGGGLYASSKGWIEPIPVEARCVITGSTGKVVLTPEQARLTSIIVGRSVARGLPPRAATIAMATAYQESGIRNLEHGDRDSLGLFQQRPSKGWGTAEQIRNPWYASDAFYSALVKVPGWETADINDTAQAVQRSGHPEAYRKHEAEARVLAEVFTGHREAGVRCATSPAATADAGRLWTEAYLTFGQPPGQVDRSSVRFRPRSPEETWRLAAFSVVNGPQHGLSKVQVGQRSWQASRLWPGSWSAGNATGEITVSAA